MEIPQNHIESKFNKNFMIAYALTFALGLAVGAGGTTFFARSDPQIDSTNPKSVSTDPKIANSSLQLARRNLPRAKCFVGNNAHCHNWNIFSSRQCHGNEVHRGIC